MMSRLVIVVGLLIGGVLCNRVPAEWEPQEAVWFQWAKMVEGAYMDQSMSRLVGVITKYEPVVIVYDNQYVLERAQQALRDNGVKPYQPNITWREMPTNNAWLRDNGPVYMEVDGELVIQNWDFDAWGGAFGENIPYANDNVIPQRMGDVLDLDVFNVSIVSERGNLEFNGAGAVMANYEVFARRPENAGLSFDYVRELLSLQFNAHTVVLLNPGYRPSDDLTGGHIDGIARFVNATTAVVGQCTKNSKCQPEGRNARIFDGAADQLRSAGFDVIRMPFNGAKTITSPEFGGTTTTVTMDTSYMNWLVGNGFVATLSWDEGGPLDQEATAQLESWFPGRHVELVDMSSAWIHGGGAHCISNDKPVGY
mmetsp:Transcript_11062/g.31027  ORF Transcript_11062/g.31027 Transcript_11062/m.31027 type:complete len:367 (+) Transcript_11062:460-1560(+)